VSPVLALELVCASPVIGPLVIGSVVLSPPVLVSAPSLALAVVELPVVVPPPASPVVTPVSRSAELVAAVVVALALALAPVPVVSPSRSTPT
jgi:hypothetical protein